MDKLFVDPMSYGRNMSIPDLVALLKKASEKYYNTGKELIPDKIFDLLLDILKDRSPDNKFLKTVGTPVKSTEKVKLPYYMGSMDKLKESTKIAKWFDKHQSPYVTSYKMDGISCLLICSHSTQKIYTRGDGTNGQNISLLLPHLQMPFITDELVVRGELIIKIENYKLFSTQYDNPRALVAGVVNSKEINKKLLAYIDFIAYEIIEPVLKPSEQFSILEEYGFVVAPWKIYSELDFYRLEKLMKKAKKYDYEVDGIIVTEDIIHKRNTKDNPSYSFAFKMMGDTAQTVVQEVEWNVSKDGRLIPRIRIEPIKLGGVIITYTSGFNARYIKDNKIGKGAEVLMVRSGDVIPFILEIISPAKADMPPKDSYEWQDDVHIKTTDEYNDDVQIKLLTKFVKTVGMEHIGEGVITKLFNNGINTVPALLSVTIDELLDVECIQARMAQKIYDSINSKLTMPLSVLMDASNQFGNGFGERKLKKIIDEIPKIKDMIISKKIDSNLSDKIIALDGFNELTSGYFIERLPNFIKFFHEVKQYITLETVKSRKTTGKFAGKSIVFSGFRNKEWQKIIEDNGGTVKSTVSANTDILVYSDTTSAKYIKAQELGINMMSEKEFSELI